MRKPPSLSVRLHRFPTGPERTIWPYIYTWLGIDARYAAGEPVGVGVEPGRRPCTDKPPGICAWSIERPDKIARFVRPKNTRNRTRDCRAFPNVRVGCCACIDV